MIIGIPMEILPEEGRVALLPQQVAEITKRGHEVLVQANAGKRTLTEDKDYIEAGAIIIEDVKELYAKSQVIFKVKEPMCNKDNEHEISLMHEGTVLITFLHPAAPNNHNMVRQLCERNITAFSMDAIPRITKAQSMDALSSMSTVAGYKAVLIAANKLPKLVPMMATAAGSIPPAKFLVIGEGVAGLQAIATAKRLGGLVHSVDIRIAAREAGLSLGAIDEGWDLPKNLVEGEGGYAKSLSSEWLEKERQFLFALVKEMDVLILSALVPAERAPVLITIEMINSMKPGSVIVDISIDQGGNCELTHGGEEITTNNGIIINGFTNLPGRVPIHSSMLYSKNICNFFLNLCKDNSDKLDLADEINRQTLITHEGRIVHPITLRAIDEIQAI